MVAVLILVAILAAVWLGIVAPLLDGFAGRASERARLATVFAANNRLVASVPRLRRAAERQAADAARFALVAPDQAAAAEVLKERLSDAIVRAGGQVRSTQDVESDPGWVAASAEARLRYPALIALLADLQNQAPYLAISTFSVAADRGAQTGAPDILEVHLEAIARHRPA